MAIENAAIVQNFVMTRQLQNSIKLLNNLIHIMFYFKVNFMALQIHGRRGNGYPPQNGGIAVVAINGLCDSLPRTSAR